MLPLAVYAAVARALVVASLTLLGLRWRHIDLLSFCPPSCRAIGVECGSTGRMSDELMDLVTDWLTGGLVE